MPCPKCLEYDFTPPLETWDKDPDGLCILHSHYPEQDKDGAFMNLIKGKMRQKDYHFAGVFFPEYISFEGLPFNNANFMEAIFKSIGDFSWTTFIGGADFLRAEFIETVDFSSAQFNGGSNFLEAKFNEKAN